MPHSGAAVSVSSVGQVLPSLLPPWIDRAATNGPTRMITITTRERRSVNISLFHFPTCDDQEYVCVWCLHTVCTRGGGGSIWRSRARDECGGRAVGPSSFGQSPGHILRCAVEESLRGARGGSRPSSLRRVWRGQSPSSTEIVSSLKHALATGLAAFHRGDLGRRAAADRRARLRRSAAAQSQRELLEGRLCWSRTWKAAGAPTELRANESFLPSVCVRISPGAAFDSRCGGRLAEGVQPLRSLRGCGRGPPGRRLRRSGAVHGRSQR